MRVNGNIIRDRIKAELAQDFLGKDMTLAFVVVGENPVVEKFVSIKKDFASRVGVAVVEKRFPEMIATSELQSIVLELGKDLQISGIVVQLPLPSHIDTQTILDAIPRSKDVDVLSREAVEYFEKNDRQSILPPVAGAVLEILKEVGVNPKGKKVLVLGSGRLVGSPVATLLLQEGGLVTVVDRPSGDMRTAIQGSEIIITGTGVPRLITGDMLTSESILVDAGTSESQGNIVGDADHSCEAIARYITPVPGGVGPVTVAILFRNLLRLGRNSEPSNEL